MRDPLRPLILALALAASLGPDVARAAGPFDGTYVGPQRQTKTNNGGQCKNINRPQVRVVVSNNVAHYSWGVPITANVGADGSFSGEAAGLSGRSSINAVEFKGRISGTSLEADIGGEYCAAHLSLTRM